MRQGQEQGTVQGPGRPSSALETRPRVDEYIGSGGLADQHRTMATAAPEDFDAAVEEARAEGNLSRANVVR